MTASSSPPLSGRVAVTRAEDQAGPLATALRAHGLRPVSCPVLDEAPLADDTPLRDAADRLGRYDWVVVASVRSVEALAAARRDAWPAGLRSAAVGATTARALVDAGAAPPPIVASGAGAAALWNALAPLDAWPGRRVLVLTTPGGRSTIIDALTGAGAHLDIVEAYRMAARDTGQIRRDWAAAAPDAAILTSPRSADALVHAIGRPAIASLRALVAIGDTTAARLTELGVPCTIAPRASFDAAAETMARLLGAEGAINAGAAGPAPDRNRP